MSAIRDNLERVREAIGEALVTKTVPTDRINEAIDAGVTLIGENRVQEAEEKFSAVRDGVRWHLIGHLQRNKVKKALPIFTMIQSIDKLETALEIERRAQRPVEVLIEINSSGEETKSGVEPGLLFKLVDELRPLQNLVIRGLMTVGPLTGDEARIREAFRATRAAFERLKERERGIVYLSMGMSADYAAAIEEGSNMVRIGSAIFGPRT
jgi:pyridoxal phosphate enzyme (YggS family)